MRKKERIKFTYRLKSWNLIKCEVVFFDLVLLSNGRWTRGTRLCILSENEWGSVCVCKREWVCLIMCLRESVTQRYLLYIILLHLTLLYRYTSVLSSVFSLYIVLQRPALFFKSTFFFDVRHCPEILHFIPSSEILLSLYLSLIVQSGRYTCFFRLQYCPLLYLVR